MLQQVAPCLTLHNEPYVGNGYMKPFTKRKIAPAMRGQLADFQHRTVRQSAVIVVDTVAWRVGCVALNVCVIQTKAPSMLSVFTDSAPFKIDSTVIMLNSVDMVYDGAIKSRATERSCDQTVHQILTSLTRTRQGNSTIPIIQYMQAHQTASSVASMLKASHAPTVRNRIDPFIARNRRPSFFGLRSIIGGLRHSGVIEAGECILQGHGASPVRGVGPRAVDAAPQPLIIHQQARDEQMTATTMPSRGS